MIKMFRLKYFESHQAVHVQKLDFDFCASRSFKFTEKVSFNIASEASYVYILSGQNFIENAKYADFVEFSNATIWVIFKQCGG